MGIVYLPKQPPDPRRQGTCPQCMAMQGERCFQAPKGGVHRRRLTANGINPADVPGLKARSRSRR
ncbi:hypothetical protein ACWGII_14475 [Streptomyces sp. NPDC054855]